MSTFIISQETMHRVVLALEQPCCPPVLYKQSHYTRSALGQILYDLNESAVNKRDGDTRRAPEYSYQVPQRAHLPVLYKALLCLIRQCTEGRIIETELYQDLNRALDHLARTIVEDLPIYKMAEWEAH